MSVVIDASAFISRFAPNQSTPAAEAFFTAETPRALIAPAILKWEARHALLKLTAAKRVPTDTIDVALAPFEAAIRFAPMPDDAGLEALVALARQAGLRLFDAAYLGLAIVANAPLATRDAALLAAAQKAGVAVIDLR